MASTMEKRIELHEILEAICPNCYFEPPTSKKLKYPCIIYKRANANTWYGNNKPYIINTRYQITVIDRDPDSELVPEIEKLEMCTFDRHYDADDLSHDVFTIYH